MTFSAVAWLKMQYLVAVYSGECGWHMVCHRSEDEEDDYIVDDILVYPQVVTSTTVNTDTAEYAKWEDSLPDEVYNNLRGHGHSHVNMGVTPSSTDLEHQSKRLDALDDDAFYIFTIWNKKGDRNWRIFDYKKNILFESADVEVLVEDDDYAIFDFMNDAKDRIKEKAYSYVGGKTATTPNAIKSQSGGSSATAAHASTWLEDDSWHCNYDLHDVFGGE